ncbi:MAG TPA: hypothetical protein VH328_03105, partial [Burkholderiaceae bacterium]|nr:hypothetical protein [Burkholderiaceae bacterium]
MTASSAGKSPDPAALPATMEDADGAHGLEIEEARQQALVAALWHDADPATNCAARLMPQGR